jgi:hypothetical protein
MCEIYFNRPTRNTVKYAFSDEKYGIGWGYSSNTKGGTWRALKTPNTNSSPEAFGQQVQCN